MIELCKLDDIDDGRSRGFLPNKRGRAQIFAVRQGAKAYVYVNNCPHYDRAPLGWKADEFLNKDGTHVFCAAHGALFRITDGACELGPCMGQSLAKLPSKIEGGAIFVDAASVPQDLYR